MAKAQKIKQTSRVNSSTNKRSTVNTILSFLLALVGAFLALATILLSPHFFHGQTLNCVNGDVFINAKPVLGIVAGFLSLATVIATGGLVKYAGWKYKLLLVTVFVVVTIVFILLIFSDIDKTLFCNWSF
ncbi:MAG TPA: hypothetical protein VLE69_03245 [Candidatus Saccharimonadales bacterium]|nr:hypothetical protein [Candidatus Saccharimonadales bacterium]